MGDLDAGGVVTLTAIVTNHDYARYLPRCIDSALAYCDEVLVYDDGSTDDSLAVLASYGDRIRVTHRDDASGDPIWGSNLGIEQATSTHLLFLDADNYLTSQPPTNDVDYTFAPIDIVNENTSPRTRWEYPDWPLDPGDCLDKFIASCTGGLAAGVMHAAGKPNMPFPWGGVWRTSFVKPLRWRAWPSTSFAADFRTALDWCMEGPSLAYSSQSFLAFRVHAGQWSDSPERALMQRDAIEFARSLI